MRKYDTSTTVILLHSLTRFRQDDSCLLLLDQEAPLNRGQLNVNPAFPKQLQLVSERLKNFRLNLEQKVSLQHHEITFEFAKNIIYSTAYHNLYFGLQSIFAFIINVQLVYIKKFRAKKSQMKSKQKV